MTLDPTQPIDGPTATVEEHVSPERVALLFDLSVSKVRKAIRRGELDVIRIGRQVRISRSSLARWIADQPAQP